MSDGSELYIGGKSLGSYLDAVKYQLEKNSKCEILSRGKQKNAKAIDVACIIKRRREDVDLKSFEIHTDAFYENEEGEQTEIPDGESFEDYEDKGYEVTKVSGIRITLEG